jgi:hypothetical protein
MALNITMVTLRTSGLYYKHVTIINDTSSGVNKLKASLIDTAKGVIDDRHMLIVQATVRHLIPSVVMLKGIFNYYYTEGNKAECHSGPNVMKLF